MDVSVIIPAYNASLLIERSVNSVLCQEGGYEIEVLVVDDCSTDDTVQKLESLKESRIRIYKQAQNMGPSAARNVGLHNATGKYVAFLDGDDYWEADFLKETVGFLEAHADAVAVSVMQCHKIIGKEPSIAPQETGVSEPVVLDDFFEFWARHNHVCTGSVLIRREVAQATGGQREDLRLCEDLEFWALLATYGKWGFIPKVLFTSDGGVVTRKQGWLEKNMIRWRNAAPFEDWRKRLDMRLDKVNKTTAEQAICKIARNLCYAHIMSERESLARAEVQKYGSYFPKNKVNQIFRLAASNGILWKLWCGFLKHREFNRAKKM